jgi:hypothetical protein
MDESVSLEIKQQSPIVANHGMRELASHDPQGVILQIWKQYF